VLKDLLQGHVNEQSVLEALIGQFRPGMNTMPLEAISAGCFCSPCYLQYQCGGSV